MGKLRNFLKSSSQKNKVSLKTKNSGTKKSREGGSQLPFQRWALPKPPPDSSPSNSSQKRAPSLPTNKTPLLHCSWPSFNSKFCPPPPHTPRHPQIPGLVSLTQKVSMPSDELQGYKRCLQLTTGQLQDMPLGPGLEGGLSFPCNGKCG